ncbi:hypothetical protein [Chryseobacterium sp. ZHDP1]|uniref:hypothetical protein n=1 Tax=Chryseobacterium sp. ZHDP1 TaxID=2838877 RepID=UPI001BE071F3|nr:hypothetical protein [Chryseobacterium sp. ZHDP1]QWA38887.1 hypothetical protein KKI44_01360 [Chryseobacterium sp. ZHDP1]
MKKNIPVKVNLNLDSYSIMETEFVGMPPRNEIVARFRMLLTLYKLQETEENLDIIGSFIIVLKKKHGVPEMDILKHIIETKTEGVTLKMQAVISAIYLAKFKK